MTKNLLVGGVAYLLALSIGTAGTALAVAEPSTVGISAERLDQMTHEINLDRLWTRGNVHGYGSGLSVAVRRATVGSGMLSTPGDFNWGGRSGTYFWVDPKEELSVVFMAAAPGEIRNRMRHLITATVLQALE